MKYLDDSYKNTDTSNRLVSEYYFDEDDYEYWKMWTIPAGNAYEVNEFIFRDKEAHYTEFVNYVYVFIRKEDGYVRFYVENEPECCLHDSEYEDLGEPYTSSWYDKIDEEVEYLIKLYSSNDLLYDMRNK